MPQQYLTVRQVQNTGDIKYQSTSAPRYWMFRILEHIKGACAPEELDY